MREWEKTVPGESRVPEGAVLEFVERLERDGCIMHGFAMLDGGKLLAEGYWAPFTKDTLHRMYSVGKSFVSLAVGLLQEEGKLGLDDFIWKFFPDKCPVEGPYPWMRTLTIRQMLSMTTCHRDTTYKYYNGDWVESFFRVKPSNLSGAVFAYDTSSTHVLSALVERLSGKKLIEYLREKCFDRIGVSREAYYMTDSAGVSQGGSGLNCTLRDVLAVAELVMNGGVCQGERLLPADYVREATACHVSTLQQPAYDEQFGYGYQIWRGRHDSFYFYGIGGQLAVCLPKEQFILVTMGNTLDNKNGIKDIFDAFDEAVYPWLTGPQAPAFREALPGEENLAEKLSGLSLSGVPSVETAYSGRWEFPGDGKWYEFAPNPLEISRLRISLEEDRGTLWMRKEGKDFVLSFGFGTYLSQSFPWTEEECYCQGGWVMEDMLFLRCHILGSDMANLTIALRIQEAGVTIKMCTGADGSKKNFEGVASGC